MTSLPSFDRTRLSERNRRLPAALAGAVLMASACSPVFAQTVSVYDEYYKQIRAPNAVTTIGTDLFGDRVNLSNGGLEFVQTDVSLRGNNDLPVSVGRRFVTGQSSMGGRAFGRWDMEIPHLHGTFSNRDGWKAGSEPAGARCTNFGSPPYTSGTNNLSGWAPSEFWHGNFMYVPGAGDQQMLLRAADNVQVPGGALASYPVVTAKFWSISCLPSLKNDTTPTKTMGEGFLAIAPDGTQYRFDWMVTYNAATVTKPGDGAPEMTTPSPMKGGNVASTSSIGGEVTPDVVSGPSLARKEVWILPSRVTDRFGSWVDYTYDPAAPANLTSITSSDGRTITLTYVSGRVSSVMDGTRTWYYGYSAGGDLVSVTLPDNSSWQFANAYNLNAAVPSGGSCDDPAMIGTDLRIGTMVHPSGATGSFTLTATVHGRSDVPRYCQSVWDYPPQIPRYYYTAALTEKAISGPGLATLTWRYNYGAVNASWAPCGPSCIASKTVSVTDPAGNVTQHTFGTRYNVTDGQLQQVSEGGLRTTTTRYRAFGAGPYPLSLGSNDQGGGVGDSDMQSRPAPVDQRIITQDGATFTWEADPNSFDLLTRPAKVTRSSSLGTGRTETTVYHDNTVKWVLGQVQRLTEANTGKVISESSFDGNTASVLSKSSFGHPDQTLTYYADGTLATRTDGNNHTTTFSNYWRGIPRTVSYPDGTSESAVVSNIGTVTALTNGAAATMGFEYDAMGRIAKVIYPTEDNGLVWNPTVIDFARVATPEYDLAAGHWRQNVTTGNARTSTYYDALWRPVYTDTSDLGNPGATSRIVKHQYDFGGRTTFASYPQRAYANIAGGVTTSYDALGRPTLVQANSELGVLTTTTAYQSYFQQAITDPRGHSTTTSYQAFDDPAGAFISHIAAPEGVAVDIARDVFGKPAAITRSGVGKSATRSYVYDIHERLCKTIEPETGATVQDYDAANNVAWRASGLALPSTTSCDTASVPGTSRISYGYDNLNRLTTTTYSDGSPAIARTYTPDGQANTIISNGALWTNAYYKRGLNKLESLAYGGATYNIGRAYDLNGSLQQLTYPDGTAVAYNPNALGEPQQVGGYATGITYHPNGAIAGFNYGNGVVHSMTQNVRGLPETSIDTGALNDRYSYDANANVAAITDQYWGVNNRSMAYDDLDRLKSVAAPNLWGSALYDYDALDNLTATTISGGATARSTTHTVNAATNRLDSISGTAGYAFAYAYDNQGNIIQHGAQTYAFDQGNRLTSAAGRATYGYDGLGHRVSVVGIDGVNRVQLYTQGGQLLQAGPTGTAGTKYIYLHNHVLAEVSAGGTQYQHTDALGSPVARTNAAGSLVSQTKYEPYGNTAQGATPTLGFTGHVNDAETGLVYMQQRYYDPVAGRFLSVDPVTTDADTGDSFNRYAYANNSPFRYKDPDGRNSSDPFADPPLVPPPPASIPVILPPLPGLPPVAPVTLPIVVSIPGVKINKAFENWKLQTTLRELSENGSRLLIAYNEYTARPIFQLVDLIKMSKRPSGAIDAIRGARDWGKKNGVAPDRAVDIFHGIKGGRGGPGAGAKDDCSVNPNTGDIFDAQGEHLGNMNEGH